MFISWVRRRIQEPATWMGMAMIAVVLGSDPMQAQGLMEAVSLIIGGGLVATGGRRRLFAATMQEDGRVPERRDGETDQDRASDDGGEGR